MSLSTSRAVVLTQVIYFILYTNTASNSHSVGLGAAQTCNDECSHVDGRGWVQVAEKVTMNPQTEKGVFNVAEAHYGIKLQHVSGEMSCSNTDCPDSDEYWGSSGEYQKIWITKPTHRAQNQGRSIAPFKGRNPSKPKSGDKALILYEAGDGSSNSNNSGDSKEICFAGDDFGIVVSGPFEVWYYDALKKGVATDGNTGKVEFNVYACQDVAASGTAASANGSTTASTSTHTTHTTHTRTALTTRTARTTPTTSTTTDKCGAGLFLGNYCDHPILGPLVSGECPELCPSTPAPIPSTTPAPSPTPLPPPKISVPMDTPPTEDPTATTAVKSKATADGSDAQVQETTDRSTTADIGVVDGSINGVGKTTAAATATTTAAGAGQTVDSVGSNDGLAPGTASGLSTEVLVGILTGALVVLMGLAVLVATCCRRGPGREEANAGPLQATTTENASYQNMPTHVYGNVGHKAQQHVYGNLDHFDSVTSDTSKLSGGSDSTVVGRFHSVVSYHQGLGDSGSSLQPLMQHAYAEPKKILFEDDDVGANIARQSQKNFEGYSEVGGYAALAPPAAQGFDYRDPHQAGNAAGESNGAEDFRMTAAHDYREPRTFSGGGVRSRGESTYGDGSILLPQVRFQPSSSSTALQNARGGDRGGPRNVTVLVPEPAYQVALLSDSSGSIATAYDRMSSSVCISPAAAASNGQYATIHSTSSTSGFAAPAAAPPSAPPAAPAAEVEAEQQQQKSKIVQIYGSTEDTDDDNEDDGGGGGNDDANAGSTSSGADVTRKASDGIYETYENTSL